MGREIELLNVIRVDYQSRDRGKIVRVSDLIRGKANNRVGIGRPRGEKVLKR